MAAVSVIGFSNFKYFQSYRPENWNSKKSSMLNHNNSVWDVDNMVCEDLKLCLTKDKKFVCCYTTFFAFPGGRKLPVTSVPHFERKIFAQ